MLNTSGDEDAGGVGSGEPVALAEIPLDELLKVALEALSEKWFRCRKCGYIWKRYLTKRIREAGRNAVKGHALVKKHLRPKRCPNCMQERWAEGWKLTGQGARHDCKRTGGNGRITGKYSPEVVAKRMRMALMERAIQMRQEREAQNDDKIRELLRRLA